MQEKHKKINKKNYPIPSGYIKIGFAQIGRDTLSTEILENVVNKSLPNNYRLAENKYLTVSENTNSSSCTEQEEILKKIEEAKKFEDIEYGKKYIKEQFSPYGENAVRFGIDILVNSEKFSNTDNNQKEESRSTLEEISEADLKRLKEDKNTRKIPNLINILPPEHFINKVTTWMEGLSDTYYEYRVCSALWLLSAIVQGKPCLSLKQGDIKPNLFLMLFGQSTKSRKSTAIKKIRNIYEVATDIDLFNDEPTIEGYLEMLSKNPIQNFLLDEASGLLAKYHKKYNEGIFDMECKIYDCDGVRKIKASGQNKDPKEFSIKNPYVTHLYATTPDKYSSVMTMEDYLCGYGYRFMYAFPTYAKDRKDIELEDNEDTEAWSRVIATTKKLHKKYSEMQDFKFTITKEALKLYNVIGRELEDASERLNNESIDSAVGRSQEHILKIAMLLEIGKEEPSHEISEGSIALATTLVINFFLPSFTQIMDRILSDVQTNKIEKAIAVIRKMGGSCTRSTLVQNGHFIKKECDEIVEAMVFGNILEEKQITGTKKIVYILTSEATTLKIQSTSLTDKISELSNLSNLSTLAQDINYPAKIAKIVKNDEKQTQNAACEVGSYCYSAKIAKIAKMAKNPEKMVTNNERIVTNSLNNENSIPDPKTIIEYYIGNDCHGVTVNKSIEKHITNLKNNYPSLKLIPRDNLKFLFRRVAKVATTEVTICSQEV